jgi:serine/threonine protein kinase
MDAVVRAGTVAPIARTLAYAAPEVVLAFSEKCYLSVHPSLDIWALGVVAYECLASFDVQAYFKSMAHVERCARGTEAYPWELPAELQPVSWRSSRAKDILLPCLERDFRKRPAAGLLLSQLVRFHLPIGQTLQKTTPLPGIPSHTEPLLQ